MNALRRAACYQGNQDAIKKNLHVDSNIWDDSGLHHHCHHLSSLGYVPDVLD